MTKAMIAATLGIAVLAVAGGVKVAQSQDAAACAYTICASGSSGSTFASASSSAQAGAIITVEPGTYPSQTILAPSTKPSGAAVTFQGNGATIQGDLTLGSTSACNGAQNLVFKNFKVGGMPTTRCGSLNIVLQDLTAQGVNIGGGTGINVLRGSFGPSVNDNSEIKNGATDVTVESAIFHDYLNSYPSGGTRPHTECIQVWGDNVVNLRVHNTIFRNCTDFDVLVKGQGYDRIVFDGNFFDNPMPGDAGGVGTASCNPNCPRGGSSLRFSTYTYPNSSVTNNIINGGLGIDCGCVTTSNNRSGTIPDVPPGTTTSTSTTTQTTTTTTTTSTTTTTQPPPDSLPLTVLSTTSTTVTVGWTPAGNRGYIFYVNGTRVSNTFDASRASVTFGRGTGRVFKVEALDVGPFGTIKSP